jgi:hypothetical protein
MPNSQEIATMWRFTRNNGITEGFHNKMETISRQAYGFRNFENYRLALDQKRGQTLNPKVVKHSWENTFDRL